MNTMKAPFLAIAFGASLGFLLALTATAKAEIISKVVDEKVELAKFKADCFKIGRLSYDSDKRQWSCVAREGGEKITPVYFK